MAEPGLSRRQLLARGAAAGGALLSGSALVACGGSSPPEQRRVVVVGAGLAGLTCAYRLHQRGIAAPVYEARPDRIGGRCWTAREFAEHQTGEHGGEFIDTDHRAIRALVDELGLQLDDRNVYARRSGGHRTVIYLDGAVRHSDAVLRGYPALQRRLRWVAKRTGYAHSYANAQARAFDRLDALAVLSRSVPGGTRSRLGEIMREYFSEEFGLDARRLTATDLLYVTEGPQSAPNPADSDPSDERFHVRGGNDLIPHGLADRLPEGTIRMDAPLESLRRLADGSYRLSFGGQPDVEADRVVLALPFTNLRDVDLDGSGLSSFKREAIENLGMGTNAKVLMQFRHRPAHFDHWNGYLVTDRPFLETWDSSLTEPGHDGLITVYSGGAVGAGYEAPVAHGPAPASVVRDTLAALERGIPGISRDFNGRAWLDHWTADPWVKGSYAAFLPGQYTRFGSVIAKSEGGIHFAGEHTSGPYQGFLEGAVRSGDRCAQEVRA